MLSQTPPICFVSRKHIFSVFNAIRQCFAPSCRIPTRSACASLGAMEFAPQNPLYGPPAVPLLLERRCRVGRARQVAAAAEQRRPMEPRRSDLAAERSSPAVSASTVSSCEPERRTQLSSRRWRYRGRVRLSHGNAPQLFRLKAALEQFLLRGFLFVLCLPHDIQRE